MINKIKGFIKNYKKTSIVLTVLLVGLVGYFAFGGSAPSTDNVVKAQIGSVKQEVSATGRVQPAQAVDLSFTRSGRATAVAVKTGDRVAQGQLLAQLDSSELLAQRQRELASITAAAQRVNQIVATSNSIQTTTSNTPANLNAALNTAIEAMVDYTTIQYAYFDSYSGEANQIANAKEEILKSIYGQTRLGRVGAWYFLPLTTGLKGEIDSIQSNTTITDYNIYITSVKSVLTQTENGLELLNARLAGSAGVQASDAALIKANLEAVRAKNAALTDEKKVIVNESYDIEIAKSQLEQAKASLALIDAQIGQNSLRAPFAGIITSVDVERGEIVTGGPTISMISLGKYEVEVNVSEADIAKLKVGNSANITLDAYGSDQIFAAVVTKIDPAARVTEGVATYTVTLQFVNQDDRILPGLTADIDIKTNEKNNVLYIPSRDIISKDGKKFVRVMVESTSTDSRFANLSAVSETETNKVYEVEVQTGLRGSDGRIEIVSGLSEGDSIVSE
jgi:HlyD family secretion protein